MPFAERSNLLAAAALATLLALAVASAALAAPPPTLGPESLAPGTRAIVRTVFRGDSIEEFQADIVGVLSGGRTEGQTIVARAVSERLKQTGVAQGMSGSPVYVDGRLRIGPVVDAARNPARHVDAELLYGTGAIAR
jgi:hypothetical protein